LQLRLRESVYCVPYQWNGAPHEQMGIVTIASQTP